MINPAAAMSDEEVRESVRHNLGDLVPWLIEFKQWKEYPQRKMGPLPSASSSSQKPIDQPMDLMGVFKYMTTHLDVMREYIDYSASSKNDQKKKPAPPPSKSSTNKSKGVKRSAGRPPQAQANKKQSAAALPPPAKKQKKTIPAEPVLPDTPSECDILLEEIADDKEILEYFLSGGGGFAKLWRVFFEEVDNKRFKSMGTKFTFKDISLGAPKDCLRFLLGLPEERGKLPGGDPREAAEAKDFPFFRSVILDYMYETEDKKYCEKIKGMMVERAGTQMQVDGDDDDDWGEEENDDDSESESEKEEEPQRRKSGGRGKASNSNDAGAATKKKAAGARPPRPPAAAAARSDGAVSGTATAVISQGRAAVKRAIKSAPASASFVETSKGSEKFFGRKLHGGNDEAIASAEILKKAKQLDFPTMYEVRKIMSDIPLDHIMERSNLRAWYKTRFPTWIDEVLAGFNILLFGVGSKRDLLNQLSDALISDGNVLVIDGLDPRVGRHNRLLDEVNKVGYGPEEETMGELSTSLEAGAAAVGGGRANVLTSRRTTKYTLRPRGQKAEYDEDVPLFLVIHNLDSKVLAGRATMDALVEIASRPNIHLIASVDHVNSPLLWTAQQCQALNWIWHEVTTLAPYVAELAARGADKKTTTILPSGEGLRWLLVSLTPRHLELLQLLAKWQLNEGQAQAREGRVKAREATQPGSGGGRRRWRSTAAAKKSKEEQAEEDAAVILGAETGMPYDALLKLCSSKLIARSSSQLDQLFTELLDHRLMAKKQLSGRSETCYIPRSAGELRQIAKCFKK